MNKIYLSLTTSLNKGKCSFLSTSTAAIPFKLTLVTNADSYLTQFFRVH